MKLSDIIKSRKSFSASSESLLNTANFKKASDLLKRAVKKYPGDSFFLISLASSLNALGEFEEAKDYLIGVEYTMKTGDPSVAFSYFKELGLIHLGQKKFDTAKGDLDSVILEKDLRREMSASEKYISAYALRGDVHRLKGQFKEAIEDYRAAIAEFDNLHQRGENRINTQVYLSAIRALRGLTKMGEEKEEVSLFTEKEKLLTKEAIKKKAFSKSTVENYFRHFK